MLPKLAALHVTKRKGFRILAVLECVLFLLGIAGLFGKNRIYEYSVDDMTIRFGTEIEADEEIWAGVLDGNGMEGNMVDFESIALTAGSYRIQLHYRTTSDEKNWCRVTSERLDERVLQTNGAWLFSGLDRSDFEMWLFRGTDDLCVHAQYAGEGSFFVSGLTIQETGAFGRMRLFVFCLVILGLNLLYFYRVYDKVYGIPFKSRLVTVLLAGLILVVNLPVSVDYMIGSGDIGYHLMRVEGIRDGICSGIFPVRISPEWQQGYGYASPIFYGETVLYIAGLFRLIGFPVTTSYLMYMWIVGGMTVLIAYACFRRIYRDAYIGFFCSMLYSLSIYRIYKAYFLGAFGEALGVTFLPLIVYGFYRIFSMDVKDKRYSSSFLPLTAGFAMLIQSHLLTCEMVGLFTILLCVILWRRVFRIKTFIELTKTVIFSLLLSAWFVIPFLDYMKNGDFMIQHASGRMIQARGLYPAHLLLTYFINGGTVFFDAEGMADTSPAGVGMILFFVLIVVIGLFASKKTEGLSTEEKGLAKIVSVFAVCSMMMSLSLFPWDKIQFVHPFIATLVSSVQTPNRFLTIANVCLTTAAGAAAKNLLVRREKKTAAAFFGTAAVLLVIGNFYFMEDGMNGAPPVRVYNNEGMGTGYISGAEYLPYGTDPQKFLPHDPVCTEGTEVWDYEKRPLGADAEFSNHTPDTGTASFPLLYYKGYRAYDEENGKELRCYAGENGEVTSQIPAGFEGKIKIRFVSPWYWRLGEAVSAATLLGLFLWYTKSGRREKRAMILEEEASESALRDLTAEVWSTGKWEDTFKGTNAGGKGALKETLGWILFLTLFASIPLMRSGLPLGENTAVLIGRIQAVAEGIGRVFPIRLGCLEPVEYCYSASAFQADVLCLIPAMLKRLGISLQVSLKISILLIHLITASVALGCFGKIAKDRKTAILMSLVYACWPYRLCSVYAEGNLAEAAALAFLPMIPAGLSGWYFSAEDEEQKRGTILLTAGMSLILICSPVTFAGAVILMMLVAAVCIGKVFKREMLKQELLFAGMTFGLNAWYLVPMLLRMKNPHAVGPMIVKSFREYGTYFIGYLNIFQREGAETAFWQKGLQEMHAVGPGFAVILLLTVFLAARAALPPVHGRDGVSQERCLLICGALSALLSLNLFPWDLLQNRNMIGSVLLALLEKPVRFAVFADLCLMAAVCVMLSDCRKLMKEEVRVWIIRVLMVLTLLSAGYQMDIYVQKLAGAGETDLRSLGDMWEFPLILQESFFWRITEGVSVIAVLIFAAMIVKCGKRGKMKQS